MPLKISDNTQIIQSTLDIDHRTSNLEKPWKFTVCMKKHFDGDVLQIRKQS